MFYFLKFVALVDHLKFHEGCSRKSPIVFEKFQSEICPSRDKVKEYAIVEIHFPFVGAENEELSKIFFGFRPLSK